MTGGNFMEKNFIPSVLICGDKEKFLANVGKRPFKIVGQIKFVGDNFNFVKDRKFLLDGKLHNDKDLARTLKKVDYILFSEWKEYVPIQN